MARVSHTGTRFIALGEVAERQNGVVSRPQLLGIGFSEDQIDHLLATARLRRVFPGSYAVGHPAIGRLGRMQAAALTTGPGSAISHLSAAELLGLSDRRAALIDVIPPSQRGRKIDGIRWHSVPAPAGDEVTSIEGIRCTNVSRTLIDLAGSRGERTLRGLIEEAAVRRSLDVDQIGRFLARAGRRRGAPLLRALLVPWRSTAEDLPNLRSRLEARLWPYLIDHGLAVPVTNATLELAEARLEVDFLWEAARLVVETDGGATHGTAVAFERDRWRDQLLVAAGYRVIRVTWEQLNDEPEAVLARIARALAAAG